MYKQNPGDPKKNLNTPGTFRADAPITKLAGDGSNPLFKMDSGLYKHEAGHDGITRDGDGNVPTQELGNVTVTARSPKTIAENVRQNRARSIKNELYVKEGKERKDVDQGKYSGDRRPVSDQDYRIFKRQNEKVETDEAVSPAQQAAIAISKKERGEKPKKESKFNTINKQLKGEK